MSIKHPLVGMHKLCDLFGKSRQAWYERQKQQDQSALEYKMLLDKVRTIRRDLPRIGAEKLHVMTSDWCHQHGIKIGRDKFISLLKEQNMLIQQRKRRVSTTISHHHFFKYPNLIKGMRIAQPDKLWVSDITYVPVLTRFSYLSLITDAYSRKIVGWSLRPSLALDGPVTALKMALAQRVTKRENKTIHHSDRGIQYCSRQYTTLLIDHQVDISMTSQGEASENQIAERINRTIKEEILENRSFLSHQHALEEIQRAIISYNSLRPHASCDYLTPEQAHLREGYLRKKWRLTKRRSHRKVQLEELELIE